MSGPTTVIFTTEPMTALLAASAIRAARAVQAGYQEAAALRDTHATDRADHQQARADARRSEQTQLTEQLAALQTRHRQLISLAVPLGLTQLPTPPALAAEADLLALAQHIEHWRHLVHHLESLLGDGEPVPPVDFKADLALPAEATPAATAASPALQATLRLLARIANLGPLPAEIDTLAQELYRTPPGERAEMLMLELRRALQAFEEQAARDASALILEQTLMDLGYQVEPVSDTLFVEGGVLHFRRPGWGNYQVRMRLNARDKAANFNVVRAVTADDNARSVLDHIAEDRWCAEFPALLQALAARGLQLTVTRRLAAGELPVQQVNRDLLPTFADDAEVPPHAAPREKSLS